MNYVILVPLGATVVNVLALVGNLAWSMYNSRMETKVLQHIDALKEWTDEKFRTRPICEELMRAVVERLNRAGA
jgi:hypothetical protein